LAASLETSSRFGLNADGALKMCGVSWGFFPSVQAGWLISSEPWFNVRPINFLKLRAGWDMTGNDAIDYFAARSYLQAVKFSDAYMGLQFANMENDGVKWESTSRLNLGFDAMFLDNRLALSFDWYNARTKDLLVQKRYPYISGMGMYWANGGKLKNVGFEATLNDYNSKNQRKQMTPYIRKMIMERDNYTCQRCGKYMPDEVGLHIDHIVPISKGGKSVSSNLQVLCSKCNGKKGAK
jgi:hypothetical protein